MDEEQAVEMFDLVQQAMFAERANTEVVMKILDQLKNISVSLAERVTQLEQQVITIHTTIRENQ
jgi:hypothetical protein